MNMNQSEKPKSVKLWKSNGGKNKKRNKPGSNSSNDLTESNVTNGNSKPKSQKFKNKKFAQGPKGANPNANQSLKRKAESSDSQPAKKVKPDDVKRKDWKMLKMDKKDKTTEGSETPKVKFENMTKKEKREYKMKKKGSGDRFEIGVKLKTVWEELRRDDCKPERKSVLLKQVCDLLKGRVKEFTFAHDTVRVLQSVLSLGGETHRTQMYEELKNDMVLLSKSKYGKFFVLKMLNYGSKPQKEAILKSFYGHVVSLIRHTEAAEVVEKAFNEVANSEQRFELLQEFYGASFKYFKDSNIRSLQELFAKSPEKKADIIKGMEEELLKILNKSVIKHSIVHCVLWEFMKNTEPSQKTEIIESLKELVPEILHTREGAKVSCHCIWFGNAKARKTIGKSMKTFVCKIAMEEFGHTALLALFDSIDDTVFLKKHIIKELLGNSLEIALNAYGRKVLIYLLNHRDSQYFSPPVIDNLKFGDNNEISKKDSATRVAELKAAVSEPLIDLVKSSIQSHYLNNSFCLFALTVLEHADGDKEEAFKAIADLAAEPYISSSGGKHFIESPGAHFFLKKLILMDQHSAEGQCKFSEVFLNAVPRLVPRSWIECNRGSFILVSLLETRYPSVVQRLTADLEGCNANLKKKNFSGAAILLKKLKMVCK